MSILSGVASALAGRGSGSTQFPAGTHLVRLAEIRILTEWKPGKPVTFKWADGSEVPAVGIEPRFSIIGDGVSEDARAQGIETMVVPLSPPPADMLADIAVAEGYGKGASGTAWRFVLAKRSLNSFLNVALGQDPASQVDDPGAFLDAVQDMVSGGANPVFQVSVKYEPRKTDPSKTNTRVDYMLAS